MSSSTQRSRWRRIYLQTIALLHKNFLIFYKAPFSLVCRALLFPIAVSIIFSVLRNLNETSSSYDSTNNGISTTSYPVNSLDGAMEKAGRWKLVFVGANGVSNESIIPIVEGVRSQSTSQRLELHSTDDPNDLFELCHQSTQGTSDCYAAVIFNWFNSSSVDYFIALNGNQDTTSHSSLGHFRTDDSLFANEIIPLQWTIDAMIGNFSIATRPSVQPYTGYFAPGASFNDPDAPATNGPYWLLLVTSFVAPVFILILIGVVYHLATFVATERESSVSELMAAQNVTITPRILANLISFYIVYFPGVLASSIILTQVLFRRTSDILFLFITLLALASIITSSHFLASFFSKAQLAGLYSSTLVFALALVTLAALLTSRNTTTQVTGLSLVFPPICWANFIADVARREYVLKRFSLHPGPTFLTPQPYSPKIQLMNGYLYVIFFIIQTVVYGAGAYAIEHILWGVKRDYQKIDANSDVALRCTGLSKTYYGTRRWYWPFVRKGKTVHAVDNLDLEVKKGSVTFLLGPNGGGKTTTLKCVAGMTGMDPGSRLELNEAGQVFGICPQLNVFWATLTVQEHIKIWRRLKTAAYEDDLKDDDDILAECDLVDKSQARAKTLSGGQMRKLQLAIAFVGGSKVCCIDEASSGLDPLSRRNIWDIIQRGHSRRTCLITTHFLDEADVLADHIAIVYKGKMVCEGPGTSLKAQFGDDYIIRSESDEDGNNMVWRTSNSAEATRKILELEALSEDSTYNVVFPTLEQVFLKVTSDTAIHDNGGDGIVGDEETTTAIDEKIFALENETAEDIELDVGHSIGIARQIAALYHKRYILLKQKSGWISYGINLAIPIIISCALVKFMYRFKPLQTCATNEVLLRNSTIGVTDGNGYPLLPVLNYAYTPDIYVYGSTSPAYLGPQSAFSGETQDTLYDFNIAPLVTNGEYWNTNATNTKKAPYFVNSINDMIANITNSSGEFSGFGLFAPTPETATLFYDTSSWDAGVNMAAFSLLTNRIANSTGSSRLVSTQLRAMSHAQSKVDFRALPIAVLFTLAFIAASSIAVIYPAFEKNNRVRALQYSNGVSPFALWFAYLVFDIQFILIEAVFVWGLIFAGPLSKLWYESTYLIGVFILFGIATYLGTYLLSLFIKKAAFAIAAGIHVLLFVLYLVAYIMNQSFGDKENLHQTYTSIQYGMGLSSPAANLARALLLAGNSFEILCGKYGTADTSNPFAYVRYGSVYANLLIQIIFLILALAIYEYGSADWWRRNVTHRGVPARLHYIVEADPAQPAAQTEKTTRPPGVISDEILNVSRITKHFGPLFAVENVSFNINANQTLALLGGNGAGKTTVINMIRGELKPDFGNIYLDGTSVLSQPHKARQHISTCPQDDAIDNLTVRQTLSFYATVKGLKNVSGNVDKVLSAMNIASFESVPVKDLSGGTRRKLSVAIALLGNPRILLLDEPSTGQDAGAKRILWKALQNISTNRAILLTTHSMEEAEALATNVAIMGTKMLATGSLSQLQTQYGGAFSIRAVRVPELDTKDVEHRINEAFGGRVSGYSDSHGQIGFNLPHEKRELGAIMRVMEGLKGDVIDEEEEEETAGRAGGSSAVRQERVRLISDYTITGPTLEEVFMNVAREAGTAGTGHV